MVKWFALSTNKNLEIQSEFSAKRNIANEWFHLQIGTSGKRDHGGGFVFELILFKLWFFNISVYDRRHWNYKADCWYEDGEEEREWEINADNMLALGYTRSFGALFPSSSGPTEFYSRTVKSSLIVNVYKHGTSWRMTDSWTRIHGEVQHMADIEAWECFLSNKKY